MLRLDRLPAPARRPLAALAIALLACAAASAQPVYPARSVRFIVPSLAGGAADILARLLAAELSQDLGRPFVVENRAGAAGNIGMEAIARAVPDGHTIGLGTGNMMAINPALYATLAFDVVRDFAPVHLLATVPNVLIVNNSLPAKDLRELIAYMKSRPGEFSYGSPGAGNTAHLYGELFRRSAGVEMTHVPYKGGNQVRQALLAGTLQLTFSTLVEAQALIQTGKVRGIAIASSQRAPGLPAVPTFGELGMQGFDSETWMGVIAPAGVPREAIAILNARIAAVLARPGFTARLAPIGMKAAPAQSPEEFARFIVSEMRKWGQLVRDSGARAD